MDWSYKSESDSSSVFHSKKCGGNMRRPQQSQEALLLQRESHRKEVDLRERKEQVVMH